jgi:hypothetical protein
MSVGTWVPLGLGKRENLPKRHKIARAILNLHAKPHLFSPLAMTS